MVRVFFSCRLLRNHSLFFPTKLCHVQNKTSRFNNVGIVRFLYKETSEKSYNLIERRNLLSG